MHMIASRNFLGGEIGKVGRWRDQTENDSSSTSYSGAPPCFQGPV